MLISVRRAAAAGALCTSMALVAAGCGGGNGNSALSSKSPKQELTASVDALSNSDRLTATFKLDATADQLKTLAQKGGGSVSSQDEQILKLLSGGHITFAEVAANGHKLSDYTSKNPPTQAPSVDVTVNADNDNLVEFRSVGGSLYARADVNKIVEITHQDPAKLAQLQSRVPPQYSFIRDALAGKWLQVSSADLKSLEQQFGAGSQGQQMQLQQQLAAKFRDALNKDVTVTRSGSTDQGDHLVLTGNAKTLYGDLTSAFTALPGGQQLSSGGLSKVPDRTVTLDAYVKDSKLSGLSLDLNQFLSPQEKAKLGSTKVPPVVLDFSDTADDISAPQGATKVDLQQIFSGLLGGVSRGSQGGATTPLSPSPTP